MDLGAAMLALLNAFVLKLVVMGLLALALGRAYGLTRAGSRLERTRPLIEPRLLRWALIVLAGSELACGIEIYILHRSLLVLALAHSLASGLGMGMLAAGLYSGLDRAWLRFAQPGCSLHRLCGRCTVTLPTGCKLRRLVLLSTPLFGLLALPAFFAETTPFAADLHRYVLPFPTLNAWYDDTVIPFVHRLAPEYQTSGAGFWMRSWRLQLEFRIFPALALLLAAVGAGLIYRRLERAGLQVLTFAAGVLSYVWLELACYALSREALSGAILHESSELFFLLFLRELLRLLPTARQEDKAAGGAGAPAVLELADE